MASKISSTTSSQNFHPMDPLSPEEMSANSLAIRTYAASQTSIKAIKFVTSCVLAPSKKEVLGYLGIPIGLEEGGKQEVEGERKRPDRRAETDFIDVVTGDAYNARTLLVSHTSPSVPGGEWKVETLVKLPSGVQPQITVQELLLAEETIRADEKVRELAAEVGITPENLFADGWSIGYDDRFPETTRLQQCLLFARFGDDDNIYAHPMDFFPVIDSNALKVIHIDFAPHRVSPSKELSAGTTSPPPLPIAFDSDSVSSSLAHSGRPRIPPPSKRHDYLPELVAKDEGVKKSTRGEVKPLHVIQPSGVSFKVDGHLVEWQKWKMHAAFHHREGITLSTITYDDDGEIRPIIYRLSLAEMVVPYAAPEHPHPRKFAFDVGEYGMGTQANELSLGCDCLGTIHYLPGSYIGHDGSAVHIKHAICIHEEDAGLLWKHTDFRPGGRVHSVRSRRLVISMICTVANYEYCFYYYFYQDGSIEHEIRLTGILNSYLLAEGESPAPFGTQVAPRINAQYHQHIFSYRIDPMIDGLKNSVIESDIVPYEYPTGSKENFAGNAFVCKERVLRTAEEGVREYDAKSDRRWSVVNPQRVHYASGKPSGYALGIKGATIEMMGREDGWASRRAAFTRKTLWVVRDREDGSEMEERLYPSGKYVPQTRIDPDDSVLKWSQESKSIDREDILLFITFGVTHIPRPEDWPVMPSEHVRFTLRPVHFFRHNPALDIPGGVDKHSTSAFHNAEDADQLRNINGDNVNGHVNGITNGTNGTNGLNGHEGGPANSSSSSDNCCA